MLMKSTVLICRSLICGNYEKMQLFSIVTKSELGFLKLTLEWRKKIAMSPNLQTCSPHADETKKHR